MIGFLNVFLTSATVPIEDTVALVQKKKKVVLIFWFKNPKTPHLKQTNLPRRVFTFRKESLKCFQMIGFLNVFMTSATVPIEDTVALVQKKKKVVLIFCYSKNSERINL